MWTKEKHIERMKPIVDKFILQLFKNGIEFFPTDGHLDNVRFKRDGKEIKMSWHSFYRFSGMSKMLKNSNSEDRTADYIIMTDELWLNMFIKVIIEKRLANA